MKKIKWIILALIVVSALFTGCQVIAEALASPDGYVYDGKTGDPLEGVTVTLTSTDGAGHTLTATTTSTGYYNFGDIEYGTFELTGTKTDYAFTPLQVSLSGLAQTFDPIVGVSSSSTELLFVLMWDSGATLDLDAHLSFPNTTQTSLSSYEAYAYNLGYLSGFTPEFASPSTDRFTVNSVNVSSPGNQIVLDVEDSDGTGPETISVSYTIPWAINDAATMIPDTDIAPLLGNGDTFPVAWVGTMEYYIDGNSSNLSTQGSFAGAHPVLYVFDGPTCLGIYRVPEYTDATVASMARIQVLTDPASTGGFGVAYYIIYPDIRLLSSSTDIRSAGSEEHAPLIVKRR